MNITFKSYFVTEKCLHGKARVVVQGGDTTGIICLK
jgi:hypothetical protein